MEINSIYYLLAIIFGFIMAWGIGANDVSNAMGTSVGSKAITIRQAIIIAAVFEFLGAFFAGSEVTTTIKQGLITLPPSPNYVHILCIGMLSSLLASACWLLVASICGWPVSTTHTIIGAILGFGIIEGGMACVQWKMLAAILASWICSPFIGAILAYALFMSAKKLIFNQENSFAAAKKVVPYYIFLSAWIVLAIIASRVAKLKIELAWLHLDLIAVALSVLIAVISKFYINKKHIDKFASKIFHHASVEKIFAVLIVFTACAMAFAHGSNDVSNAIGPLSAVISALEPAITQVPVWVLLVGSVGIITGLATYGHKVIATVGTQITHLTPSRGFSATLAAAITVLVATNTGLPISTTHTLIGGIFGVGLAHGLESVNFSVLRSIVISWVITFPIGAILSIIFYKALSAFFLWYSLG